MNYSQNDPKWKDLKIKGKHPFSKYGCLVCCVAYIMELDVALTLKILNDNDCFTENGVLIWDLACKALGASYGGKVFCKPKSVTIMETDHFRKSGFPQHFCVWLTGGKILDPLTGNKIVNPYHIVSYRLFKKKPKLKPVEDLKTLPTPIVGQNSTTPMEAIVQWLIKMFTTISNYLNLKK